MQRRLVHCCFLWPKQGIECDRVCSGALHSPERSLEPLLSTRRSPDARHRISCEASTQSEASIEASMRSFTRSFTRSFNFELGTTRFRRLLLLSPTSHAFSSHPTLCTSSNTPHSARRQTNPCAAYRHTRPLQPTPPPLSTCVPKIVVPQPRDPDACWCSRRAGVRT